MRKVLSVILSVLMMAVSLTGCNDSGPKPEQVNDGTKTPESMGRYVETEIDLPDGFKDKYNPYIYNYGDSVRLLGRTYIGDDTDNALYELKSDGSWEDITPDWLNESKVGTLRNYQELDNGDVVTLRIKFDEAVLGGSPDGKRESFIKRYSAKDNTVQDINLELPAGGEQGEYIISIYVLSNGDILAASNCNMAYYYYKNGETECSKSLTGVNREEVIQIDDASAIVMGIDSFVYVDLDHLTVGELVAPKELHGSVEVYNKSKMLVKGNDIYMINEKGLHKGKLNSDNWETIMDGVLTSFNKNNFSPSGFAAGYNNDFYVSEHFGKAVYRYVFDEDVPTVPRKEIKIVSILDNSNVRDVITECQKQDPDLYINYEVLYTRISGTMAAYTRAINDALLKLNTEVLAGKGPDIFVLDTMPWQSYAEKGILMDLTDILEPYAQSGEYYSDVLMSCSLNGRNYGAVTGFDGCYILTKSKTTEQYASLKALAEYTKDKNVRTLDSYWYANDFENFFGAVYGCYGDELYNEDGEVTKELLKEWLNNAKVIYDSVNDGYNGPTYGYPYSTGYEAIARLNMFDTGEGKIQYNCSGYAVIAKEYPEITPVNTGKFAPLGVIGINAKTEYPDEAKSFLKRFIESENKTSSYDDLPVKKSIIEKKFNEEIENYAEFGDRHSPMDKTYDENGAEVEFNLNIDIKSKEQADWLIKDYENFSIPVERLSIYNLGVIPETILSKGGEFFDGKQTVDQAVDEIMSYIKIMQSE